MIVIRGLDPRVATGTNLCPFRTGPGASAFYPARPRRTSMKVGVIGLGTMGMGAALNLLRKGHDVTGCELRAETRTAFAQAGGTVVDSPAALPADLEAVVVFVINAAQ